MPFRALELPPQPGQGRVWLSSMPGRHEPWPAFLQEARERHLSQVLCLNPLFEVQRLSPDYAAAIAAGTLPFRWTHLPMQDFGLAEALEVYRTGIDGAADTVRSGGAVLLHCAAGIGRTGTTAACLLKRLGAPTALALQRVREAGSNPESALQQGLIERF
ncbi:MAG TPA: tyrosine-protein phosphatase [Rubrivivax sp.]|nr:tyrosine-protein phosphatase [Burkholderiales bacterium]HNT37823.1 tyrosine-protein phosphatase [Rubrivivax sp.]